MNKALERPVDTRIENAFNDAYNKKNRMFTYGGISIKIPTQAKEEDIKDLCASLFKGSKDKEKELLPCLLKVRKQLIEEFSKTNNIHTESLVEGET